MASGTVAIDLPIELAIASGTLTRLAFGTGVDWVHVNSDVDMFVVVGGSYSEGNPTPTGNRYRVPAGVVQPIRNTGKPVWLAGQSSAGTVWGFAFPMARFFPVLPVCTP